MCFCHAAEEDASELDRLRRLLCIPRADVDKVNKEICGRIYQEVSPLPLLISGTAMAGGVAYLPALLSSRLLHGFLCVRKCFGVLCATAAIASMLAVKDEIDGAWRLLQLSECQMWSTSVCDNERSD